MDYFKQNKTAWEEAFDNRHPEWGSDIFSKVKEKKLHFFSEDMVEYLQNYHLEGKEAAHFCCNNGRELLSLVNSKNLKSGCGFDIAENQIQYANQLAAALDVNCKFSAVNIMDIDRKYHNRFDMIIITIGTLCWFKDLKGFFAVICKCLKENGVLLINEQHPLVNMLGLPGEYNYDELHPTELLNSYFTKEWITNEGMYYMTKREYKSKTFIDYTHSVGEIINSIISVGLTVLSFNEFDYDISGSFSMHDNKGLPLSCLIEARKSS